MGVSWFKEQQYPDFLSFNALLGVTIRCYIIIYIPLLHFYLLV